MRSDKQDAEGSDPSGRKQESVAVAAAGLHSASEHNLQCEAGDHDQL